MIRRALAWLARRRPWPTSLRGRLIALLLAALLLAQAVALAFFFDERRLAVRAALAEEAISRAASVALLMERLEPELQDGVLTAASTRLARFDVSTAPLEPRPGFGRESRRLRAYLVATLDEMSDRNWSRRVRVSLAEPRPGGWRGDRGRDRRGRDRRHGPLSLMISIDIGGGQWLNVETRFRRPPLQWAWPSILSMALTAVAIIVIVSVTIGRLTRPLRDLAAATERFGRGARGEPIAERGPVEARRLIATFNAMQERLTRFVADRTRLLASISHDLRTPLTAMRIRAELVENEETRGKLIEGLDDMQRMVEATLVFAKQDAAEEPTRPVDLAALVESAVEDFVDLGATVEMAALERCVVDCRPDALKRALRNLIENAVRYGDRAFVSMRVGDQAATIRVDDEGPGAPPEKTESLFEPFARLEESRSRETGGVGLGLSIARSIVRAHGGDVTLSNRREGGLRAEITLPMTS